MAGMPSEQVSLGVYDLASQQTVFLAVTDFGREQYLTNITWGPASEVLYIQGVNRYQNQVHLNKYCAKTGVFIKTLVEEKNERYVEPSDPLVLDVYKRQPYYLLEIRDQSGTVLYQAPVPESKEVLPSQEAYVMSNILSAVINEGTGRRLRTTYGLKNELAGKTGTTQNQADGWFIGYNSRCV